VIHSPLTAAAATPGAVTDARVLVISADGSDSELAAITQTLRYLGTPYDVLVASQAAPLTAAQLGSGNHGKYNAVMLTRGDLVLPDGTSAFTSDEFQTLATYEASFGVRRVSLYTWPDAGYGFSGAASQDTSTTPLATQCTSAGRAVFPYVNCGNGVTIGGAWSYPATPADSATVPLLVDGQGRVLAATRSYGDGREALALTFAQSPFLVHTLQLFHGVVSWATRGVFLGERHAYLGVQVDDLFLADALYAGGTYRITAGELQAALDYQNAKRQQATTADMRFQFAFNGYGTVVAAPDALAAKAQQLGSVFHYISHTYDHASLDAATYDQTRAEISRNVDVAGQLSLAPFSVVNLVTPGVSGLNNAEAMRAIFDGGVRYLVTDTSQPGQNNPTPNAGIYNTHEPSVLMIPRRSTNLYFNVSTPQEWVTEYNDIYRGYWGRDLSYDEILGHESDVLVQYLLKGENDPWMFHQTDLRVYSAGHTILGDLLDRTFAKYTALVTVPPIAPTMDQLGGRVADRMGYDAAGASGTVDPAAHTITLHAARAATVPVTGACGTNAETYAGQRISYVPLTAGGSATLPLAAAGACP
jgi:hypothetical protein